MFHGCVFGARAAAVRLLALQSGTSGLMTETASPEQPSNRSLRGVRHTFYTHTNTLTQSAIDTHTPARFKVSLPVHVTFIRAREINPAR